METNITNIYKLDLELYTKYFYYHITKPIRIISIIISLIGSINTFFLIYTNFKFELQNTGLIIGNIIMVICSILITIFCAGFLAGYELEKLKIQEEENLDFYFVFEEEYFYNSKKDTKIREYYIDIKKVLLYNEFIIIKMKNKRKYLLKNDSFNIDDLSILLEKIEGGAALAE